jgi:hypothetical protein
MHGGAPVPACLRSGGVKQLRASWSNPDDELLGKLRFGRSRKRIGEDQCSCTVDRAPQGQPALACRKFGNDPGVAAEVMTEGADGAAA